MEQEQPVRRRLAAIVAADVAGYSRLMGLDEVGTARTLREHRKVAEALVAKHGGRVVKTTGDGVLLEFPSVVDAVECAVAVQAVMAERNEGVPEDRRMLFRIGINLVDILIEGDGDILGDGVNVAARLEGIAEPGGICISSSTYAHVEQALRLSPRDTYVYIWALFVGLAKFWHGTDVEAIVWFRRSLEANRNYPSANFHLAAALAHLGELDEAGAAAQAGLALDPSFSIRRFRINTPSNHPVYLAGRERLYEGLRMAGVPEG
jgi:hypothetical protein